MQPSKTISTRYIALQIADYEGLYPLLAETDFPDELIMRSNSVRFARKELLAG
jgi:hypothetical protein